MTTTDPRTNLRLFIAIPLSREVEQALGRIIGDLSSTPAKVKWVEPHNIHMTIRFLGDTGESLIPALKQLINEAAAHATPCHVKLSRLGAFPNLTRPRVIWAGFDESSPLTPLQSIAEKIELGVRQLGFEPESKSFKPHLTLARVKFPDGLQRLCEMVRTYPFAPIDVSLDRLVLFKSTLTPRGPVYEKLHESVFGAERFG